MMTPTVKIGARIKAEDFNRLTAQTNSQGKIVGSSGVTATVSPAGIALGVSRPLPAQASGFYCMAINTGATTIGMYAPAVVTGQPYASTDQQIYGAITLNVRKPTASDSNVPFVIATEEIAAGGVGRVCTMGNTLAYTIPGTGNYAALAGATSTVALVIGSSGAAQVFWPGDTGSPRLAVVQLGGGAASGGSGSSGIIIVETYEDLARITASAPMLAFTTVGQRLYSKSGTAWICLTHIRRPSS